MSIYDSLSLDRVQSLLTKGQVTAATKLYTEQKTELPDNTAATVKQNYDVVTVSEEGKAVAQVLNASPVEGSTSEDLYLDAVGESTEPSHVVRDITDYAAQEAFEKRCNTFSDLIASRNALIEELKFECDNRPWYYSAETGLYYVNYSATTRLVQTRLWEWEQDLKENNPYAYELWVEHFGAMKEPKFPEPSEGDVYQVIDLTPDAEGKTELDRFHMLLQRMKDQAALIEEQFRENRKREEEESGEPSVAERLETQNAKLEETLQTNDLEAFEIRLEPPGGKEE